MEGLQTFAVTVVCTTLTSLPPAHFTEQETESCRHTSTHPRAQSQPALPLPPTPASVSNVPANLFVTIFPYREFPSRLPDRRLRLQSLAVWQEGAVVGWGSCQTPPVLDLLSWNLPWPVPAIHGLGEALYLAVCTKEGPFSCGYWGM